MTNHSQTTNKTPADTPPRAHLSKKERQAARAAQLALAKKGPITQDQGEDETADRPGDSFEQQVEAGEDGKSSAVTQELEQAESHLEQDHGPTEEQPADTIEAHVEQGLGPTEKQVEDQTEQELVVKTEPALTLAELFEHDLQKLVDDEVLFEFLGVEGNVKYVNGVAAGGAWYEFEFMDGPFAGREIFCTGVWGVPLSFKYLVHASEDGFVFNKDPSQELRDHEGDEGGGFYPEWNGLVFTVKVAPLEEEPTVIESGPEESLDDVVKRVLGTDPATLTPTAVSDKKSTKTKEPRVSRAMADHAPTSDARPPREGSARFKVFQLMDGTRTSREIAKIMREENTKFDVEGKYVYAWALCNYRDHGIGYRTVDGKLIADVKPPVAAPAEAA